MGSCAYPNPKPWATLVWAVMYGTLLGITKIGRIWQQRVAVSLCRADGRILRHEAKALAAAEPSLNRPLSTCSIVPNKRSGLR